MKSEVYFAIIGDLIDSKSIKNRDDVQKCLDLILISINQKYSKSLESEFSITLGDEFQGLVAFGEDVPDIIESIELELFPVKARFGIGVGEIATDIIRESPFGMDGQAYHYARDCINEMKKSSGKSQNAHTNIMIKSDMNETPLLNAVFIATTSIKNRWTEPQWNAIKEYKFTGNQIEAAKKLGITQSALQQRIANADYYSYRNAQDSAGRFMEKMTKEYEKGEGS